MLTCASCWPNYSRDEMARSNTGDQSVFGRYAASHKSHSSILIIGAGAACDYYNGDILQEGPGGHYCSLVCIPNPK